MSSLETGGAPISAISPEQTPTASTSGEGSLQPRPESTTREGKESNVAATADVREARERESESSASEVDASGSPAISEHLARPSSEAYQERHTRIQELGGLYADELREGLAAAGADYADINISDVDPTTWEPCAPEETRAARREYTQKRADLISAWEQKNDAEWPRYATDTPGPPARVAGQPFDCHHIQPLSAGGRNHVDNIVPLSVERHMAGTEKGVHRAGSPLSRIVSAIKQG